MTDPAGGFLVNHRCAREGCCSHRGAWGAWLPFRPLQLASGLTSTGDLAAVLGVTTRAVERWAARDAIPVRRTDELAVALGLHPFDVWGDEWFVIFELSGASLDVLRPEQTVRAREIRAMA